MNKEALGAKVRALRNAANMSQEELAGHAGVARRVVQQLEAGRGNPTIDTLDALADALGCTLADLYAVSADGYPDVPGAPEPFSPGWQEAADLLDAIVSAGPLRRLIALYVVTGQRRYLDEIRALPDSSHAVRFLQSLPRR